MQILENKALQLTLPAPLAEKSVELIDRCKVVQDFGTRKNVVVYWGFDELSALAQILDTAKPNMEIPDVVSPILRDYNWPGVFKPFDHQKDTASFLSLRRRAFCFNEAGTGKTSAAVWAADYLITLGQISRVLVICPLSIMQSAWQADIFKTAMHRTCGVAHGTADKRKRIIDGTYEFVIINFDGVHTVFDDIQKANFDLIIVDEANAYKTTTTRRWKTLAKLVRPDTRLWMMTGTPAAQSPTDAFGLARLIAPDRVPKYSGAWRDRVMNQLSRFKWVPKHNATQQVHDALQPAIRFTKKQCLDLPEVVYQTRDVPLSPQTQKYYNVLKKQLLIEAAGEQITAVNAAASLNKLLQISGGAVYTDKREVVEFDIRPRLNALEEVLAETLNKVVVFVPFIHTIDVVKQYLNDSHVSCEVIQGSVSLTERTQIIQRFQSDPEPRVLIIQPQSAAHGITLTAADTVVFWSPVMSVETYLQCIARIDRVGQRNTMTVVHLQGSDVERRMYNMLQGKVDSHQKLVDLYQQELEENDERGYGTSSQSVFGDPG
jgi:SNF2 family DNA or RNA helicase